MSLSVARIVLRSWKHTSNRYDDPQKGQFLTVDPLVKQTGAPEIVVSDFS